MALHEIIRVNSGDPNISAIYAAAASRGTAFQLADATNFELADGTKPLAGFLTRDVTTDGPGLADHFWPGRLELPEKAGNYVSAEKALDLEVEGDDFLNAEITAEIASGTLLSFAAGKFCLAGETQFAEYAVVDVLTPEVAGNVRIAVTKVTAHVVPASS